jgi:2-keto-4-pentenoate hydratase/2-oxohepta-3-ene-1,7-dioic acid hydratase in catechol pathway
MRIARFDNNRVGIVMGESLQDVSSALEQLPAHRHPFPPEDALVANLELVSGATSTRTVPIAKAKLLSPVANPGKVMAAPVNYKKHLEEALADKGIHHGNLVGEIHKVGIFLKASSSVVGPGEGVQLIKTDRRNDHEVELAVVIGLRGRNITPAEALSHVAGYCIGLDMTIRGPEERSMRKSPDSYTVLGPWLVTADEIPDPTRLTLTTRLNDQQVQHSGTDLLIYSVPQIIAFCSDFTSLLPGDVIATGTPEGVGHRRTPPLWMKSGDVLEVEISGIGALRSHVIDER